MLNAISETFTRKHKCMQHTTKTGLRLLPSVFPTDNDLVRSASNLERIAVVWGSTQFAPHVVELHFCLRSAGFHIIVAPIEPITPAKSLFMYLDMRNNACMTRARQALVGNLSLSTTVLLLVDDPTDTILQDDIPYHTTIITCVGVPAMRAFIMYAQTRQSRFNAFELSSSFADNPSVNVYSNDKRRGVLL